MTGQLVKICNVVNELKFKNALLLFKSAFFLCLKSDAILVALSSINESVSVGSIFGPTDTDSI